LWRVLHFLAILAGESSAGARARRGRLVSRSFEGRNPRPESKAACKVCAIGGLARTRRYVTPLGVVSLHHIQPAFFFGFEDHGDAGGRLATPEKGPRRFPLPHATASGDGT
jgi:hypothetical protein